MPFAELPSKPGAPLFYELISGTGEPSGSLNAPVLVFINGLGLPCSSWRPVISLLTSSPSRAPQMLIYDRFGQGETESRDPADSLPGKEAGYGHDLSDIVGDLDELLRCVIPPRENDSKALPRPLLFVAASIGVNIARLYAASHPGTVAGLLFLDSNMATVDTWLDVWPDPDAPGFDEAEVVGPDCTLATYKTALQTMRSMFDASVKNGENLDRRTTHRLLPDPSRPKLEAYRPSPSSASAGGGEEAFATKGPFLTVAGHDPETFAQEGLDRIKVPKSITTRFTQPAWQSYNEGLLKLSDPDRTTGVIHAPGCGHFIQRDNPQFVANIITDLVRSVEASLVGGIDTA